MELVKPYAELWNLPNDALIVKCAQLCYASEKPPVNINDWLEEKWKNGHKSIFRHATYYYVIPCINVNEILRGFFKNNIGYNQRRNSKLFIELVPKHSSEYIAFAYFKAVKLSAKVNFSLPQLSVIYSFRCDTAVIKPN